MARRRSKLQKVAGVRIWRRKSDPPHARWKITYLDPRSGRPRHESVSQDYDTTVEYAREVQKRIDRGRLGLADAVRDRWAEEDLKPIDTHLEEFKTTSLQAAKRDAKHVRQFHACARALLLGNEAERRELAERKRLKRGERRSSPPAALKSLGITRVSQIVPSKVQAQVGKVNAQRSNATANRYLDALNAFLNWGVRDGRWERNVCRHIPRYSADEDRRHVRRALDLADFARLIESLDVAGAPVVAGLTGAERSRLYRFAVASGLRRKEVRGARVADLELQPTPGVWTRASISRKNKKRIFVPLPPTLADELAEAAAGKDPDAPLVKCPANTARLLRGDLERAGIEYRTAAGVFDFHAVRHECGTLLISAGVTNVKAIQAHLRHSRSSLTLDTYGHLLEKDKGETARALPDFGARRLARRKTGNDVRSDSLSFGGSVGMPDENSRKTQWSDGESNPDLLNAIQDSNPGKSLPHQNLASTRDGGAAPGAARRGFYVMGGRARVRRQRAVKTPIGNAERARVRLALGLVVVPEGGAA